MPAFLGTMFLYLLLLLLQFPPPSHQSTLQFCQNFVKLRVSNITQQSVCPGQKRICCAFWATDSHLDTFDHENQLIKNVELRHYCCGSHQRCCDGRCCALSDFCCGGQTDGNTLCCPERSGCCKNTHGEVACCPQLVQQIWLLICIISITYLITGCSRAVRAYCNIRPFEEGSTQLLSESEISAMRYCFC